MRAFVRAGGFACNAVCMGARVHQNAWVRVFISPIRSHVHTPTRACTCVCTYMRMHMYPQAWKANRRRKGGRGMPGVGKQIVARLQTLPFSLSGTFLSLDVI